MQRGGQRDIEESVRLGIPTAKMLKVELMIGPEAFME